MINSKYIIYFTVSKLIFHFYKNLSCYSIIIIYYSFILFQILVSLISLQFIQTDHKNKRYLTNDGKEITFHGLNIVYKETPYYPYLQNQTDGVQSLSDEDIQWISDNGFNFIRLGVQMPGVMPQQDQPNMTYLDEMKKIVDRLAEKNIYTLVEMHQDVLSKHFCGNGMPLWVLPASRSDVDGFPMPLEQPYDFDEDGIPSSEQCSSRGWASYYFTDMVAFCFKCLYNESCRPFEEGSGHEDIVLQDEVKKYWKLVTDTFKDNEYVMGYEIINEPNMILPSQLDNNYSYLIPANFERDFLEPFYLQIIDTIYDNDQNHIIHFEPCADNWFKTGMTDIVEKIEEMGVPKDKVAWTYHVYCSMTNGDPTKRLCTLEENLQYFSKVTSGIENLNLTSFADEFGAFPDDDIGHKTLIDQLSIFEMFNQPWAFWCFKLMSNDEYYYQPGHNNQINSVFNTDGTEQTVKVTLLSHPYMNITSGRIISQSFEQYGKTLSITMITGEVNETSNIVLATHWKGFGKTYVVRQGIEGQDFELTFTDDNIVITNLKQDQTIEIVFW